ncbi:MAG: AAA family ATPase [Proteobacteria bacterium]|nr:AAA family ATPase [Pseudomonadota bacterium]
MREAEQSQRDLVRAFTEGRVTGAPAPVERIDTHLSHVFLSGDRAFKLKRAIQLPFVDFSSREARRKACEAELVNQPMGRALYLEALPITQDSGGFRLGGEGSAVDWVVAMRRFEQAQQFDRLAARGALTRAMIEEAAEAIARAHELAPVSEQAGQAVHYRGVIEGLRRTEEHGARRIGLEPGSPALFERLEQELARIARPIEERRRHGKVRRGHGDLHLRNICMYENKPLAFDAIEFDESLATVDVLYDFAFLLMDLRRVGLAEHANAAMNRYWDVAGEREEALALLPFFTSLRAAVRMAVAVEAGELEEAQSYRLLGLQLLQHEEPRLIAIGGLSGTGKTAVAQAVAPRLPGPAGARVLRSDVLRKRKLDLRIDQKAALAAYTAERRAETYRDLIGDAARAVEAGATVIADATFVESAARTEVAAAAGRAQFHPYWLQASTNVRLSRVSGRTGDASDAGVEVAARQAEPADIAIAWMRLDANRPVSAIADDIMSDLASTGVRVRMQ